MKMDLTGLLWYLVFGMSAGAMMTWESQLVRVLGFMVCMAVLLVVDMRSFKQGLKRGTEIANEVLHELCVQKKIAVVPAEGADHAGD